MRDEKSGRFMRTFRVWDESLWNEGYIDNKQRFRVYRPDYPRAYRGGFALRYHVVWWLRTGQVHPKGTNLHHKNHVKNDDRFENLELMKHGEHTRFHCVLPDVKLVCCGCTREFLVKAQKYNSRIHEGTPIRFCSQHCYHKTPRTEEHKHHQSIGLRRAYAMGAR